MRLSIAIEYYVPLIRVARDEELENKRIRIYRKRENTAERESYKAFKAEVGTPGAGNTGTGNMVEPQPKNDVPSLKRRKRVMTDEEQEREEEKVLPDAAKKRKRYRQERIGKSGGLQVW